MTLSTINLYQFPDGPEVKGYFIADGLLLIARPRQAFQICHLRYSLILHQENVKTP